MSATTPSTVREAFVPDQPHELSLRAILVLETLDCAYLTGGRPTLRDAVLVWLAMTDLDALQHARAEGEVDAHVEAWGADKRPADLLALQPAIAAAVKASFAPGGEAEPDGESDPLGKKDAPAAAGG